MTDYPSNLRVAPLTTWPGELTPPGRQRWSPFSAKLSTTLAQLTTELAALSARTPVLEVAIPESQFRIDGRPYANARADHPGVVLSLPHTTVGPLRYAADRFNMWQDNLRAITLGLEALRKVERYGITRRGEQYAGFKALPPGGIPMPAAPMTKHQAAVRLGELGGSNYVPDGDAAVDAAYRDAAKRHHPDAGGDAAVFQELQDVMRVLRGEQS